MRQQRKVRWVKYRQDTEIKDFGTPEWGSITIREAVILPKNTQTPPSIQGKTMSNLENALEIMKERIGEESPPGDWVEITQEMVNKFADATGDHQWIHVDVERAKQGPFGGPIAHGQLTLSILGLIGRSSQPSDAPAGPRIEGQRLAINYGFNRVRFPSPVPVGSRVRARRVLKTVEEKGGMVETMSEVIVDVEGQDKPACVAETLARMVF